MSRVVRLWVQGLWLISSRPSEHLTSQSCSPNSLTLGASPEGGSPLSPRGVRELARAPRACPTTAAGPRVAFSTAKSRAIAIPVDLDSQVNNLFLKSHNIVQKTALNWRLSARNAARRDSVLAASRDYRNIIERLQVTPAGSTLHPAVLLEPGERPRRAEGEAVQ